MVQLFYKDVTRIFLFKQDIGMDFEIWTFSLDRIFVKEKLIDFPVGHCVGFSVRIPFLCYINGTRIVLQGILGLMFIRSIPIFSTLQCIPNLTIICSQVNP